MSKDEKALWLSQLRNGERDDWVACRWLCPNCHAQTETYASGNWRGVV